jgi:hypothetical protein
MEAVKRWWESFELREAVWYRWCLEGAEIFVCRRENQWYSLCRRIRWKERSAECSGPLETEEPRGAVHSALWGGGSAAALRPYLPVKPFLTNPGLLLFPGMETSLELDLPPLLYVSASAEASPGRGNGETLFTIVPFTLNESWYGVDTMHGILCSSLPPSSGSPGAVAIRCRVLIRNRARTVLELDKLPLHAGELGVYERDGELISDTPVIDVYGEGDYRMSVKAPEEGNPVSNHGTWVSSHGTLLAPGNKSGVGDMLIHHGTRIIKNITGYDDEF